MRSGQHPYYRETTRDLLGDIAHVSSQIRTDHKKETSTLQRGVDYLTALVGWPGFVALLMGAIALWVSINLSLPLFHIKPVDTDHFAWLQVVLATGAIFVAVLILTTQRRADQLSDHRSQLTLELVIMIDRKIAKIIELIEEQRRDNTDIVDRVDGEASDMSTPSDTDAVLRAIKDEPELSV